MRIAAYLFFAFAALATLSALNAVVEGANRPEGTANLVGYAVGSFLVPIVLLIIGLVLWGKAKP